MIEQMNQCKLWHNKDISKQSWASKSNCEIVRSIGRKFSSTGLTVSWKMGCGHPGGQGRNEIFGQNEKHQQVDRVT